jgi:hypothetical protein
MKNDRMSRKELEMLDEHTAILPIDRALCERYLAGETSDEDQEELDKVLGNLCVALRDLSGAKIH